MSNNTLEFIKRIQQRANRLGATSKEKQAVLARIGMRLQADMVMLATSQNIVDTGALRQSLRYVLSGDSVEVGSFGVSYARFHEFGAKLTPAAVRAMFASMKKRSKLRRAGKGVFTSNGAGGGTLRARPYVRPSLRKNRAWIDAQIKDYLNGN